MWIGHVFEVCERISEAQVILHNQEEGRCSAEQALAGLRALLSEPGVHEAMYNLGYFPKTSINPDGAGDDHSLSRSEGS